MTEQEWLVSEDPAAMLRWAHPDSTARYENPPGLKTSDRKLRLFACACCRLVWGGAACRHCDGRGEAKLTTAIHAPTEPCPWCYNGKVGGLTDPRGRRAVEVAERYADGLATEDERRAAYAGAGQMLRDDNTFEKELAWKCAGPIEVLTANAGLPRWFSVSTKLAAAQAALLRDTFGNPFRPVVLQDGRLYVGRNRSDGTWDVSKADWFTQQVLALARAAYDERRGQKCGRCGGSGLVMLGDGPARVASQCPACGGTGRTGVGLLDPYRLAILRDSLMDAGCDEPALLAHLADAAPHARGCWAIDILLGKS